MLPPVFPHSRRRRLTRTAATPQPNRHKENPLSMRRTTVRLLLALSFASAVAFAGLARPRGAAAQSNTSNTNKRTQDVVIQQFVPCANGGAGEDVLLTGTLHDIIHFSVNDNHALIDTFSNYQHFSGVGLTSGDRYRLTGGGHALLSFDVNDGAPEVDSFHLNVSNVIGQGKAPNLILRDTSHLTINANGEVTAAHSNFVFECK